MRKRLTTEKRNLYKCEVRRKISSNPSNLEIAQLRITEIHLDGRSPSLDEMLSILMLSIFGLLRFQGSIFLEFLSESKLLLFFHWAFGPQKRWFLEVRRLKFASWHFWLTFFQGAGGFSRSTSRALNQQKLCVFHGVSWYTQKWHQNTRPRKSHQKQEHLIFKTIYHFEKYR